jgi:hypothetical protein
MSREIDCPQCHTINSVPESTVGSYATCKKCKCMFWVTVPPLGEESRPALRETMSEARTVAPDESARSADQASKTLMRQEALLYTIVQEVKFLRKALWCFGIGVIVLILASAAVCVSFLR